MNHWSMLTFLIVIVGGTGAVFAHSGGTNADGCHNDNINGGYHCHNEGTSSTSGGAAIAPLSYEPSIVCGNGIFSFLSGLTLGFVGMRARRSPSKR